MKFLRRFLIRLSNFTAVRSANQRLQDEIAEHLAFQTEENLRAGMPPAEARRQAISFKQIVRPLSLSVDVER